ncbi:hypothetical protein A2U01_0040083, partial [Trifolium medium]|nr:hypothetical protein [Trifolium medium]
SKTPGGQRKRVGVGADGGTPVHGVGRDGGTPAHADKSFRSVLVGESSAPLGGSAEGGSGSEEPPNEEWVGRATGGESFRYGRRYGPSLERSISGGWVTGE